jgi:hypothetical protein
MSPAAGQFIRLQKSSHYTLCINGIRDTRCSANEEKDDPASRAEPAYAGNDSGTMTPEFVYKRERDSTSCDFP